jgi:hypothetical protein
VHRGHRGWQVPDTHEIGSHKPGTAAPNCNPSYSGGSRFKASLDKQFMRPYLKKKKKTTKKGLVQWLKASPRVQTPVLPIKK